MNLTHHLNAVGMFSTVSYRGRRTCTHKLGYRGNSRRLCVEGHVSYRGKSRRLRAERQARKQVTEESLVSYALKDTPMNELQRKDMLVNGLQRKVDYMIKNQP